MSTKKLLKKAERNLYRVIEDPQFWTPAFCRAFFDWCDEQAYEFPDSAIRRGDLAVELSKKTGDPHVRARAQGVIAIAYRLVSVFDRAEAEFDQGFRRAGSCSCCLSDLCRRKGSMRMYQKQFANSIALYDQAIAHYHAIGDIDGIGGRSCQRVSHYASPVSLMKRLKPNAGRCDSSQLRRRGSTTSGP